MTLNLYDMEKITRRWDPEHDLGPVTWQDNALAEAVLALAEELNQTKDELAWVKQWIELHEREAVLVRPSAPPWETF